MDRRGFLRGLLAAPVAGALVVRPAEADAVELFKPTIHEPVMIRRTSVLPETNNAYSPADMIGTEVYNASGQVVGYITEVSINTPAISYSRYGEDIMGHYAGLPEVLFRGVGVWPHKQR